MVHPEKNWLRLQQKQYLFNTIFLNYLQIPVSKKPSKYNNNTKIISNQGLILKLWV